MRRYWYYTYNSDSLRYYQVTYSDSGEFELAEEIEKLKKRHHNHEPYITNWMEISANQYQKLKRKLEEYLSFIDR